MTTAIVVYLPLPQATRRLAFNAFPVTVKTAGKCHRPSTDAGIFGCLRRFMRSPDGCRKAVARAEGV
jgi:hypothetical protein